MHIHILGIAGTFMASLAIIAKSLGHKVTGMDKNAYPPMSIQLKKQNISYTQGYALSALPKADIFIIGNALSRGNPCIEEILNKKHQYTSGAQWLTTEVLHDKQVLAVTGTHGKTSTANMLAWILEEAGLNPSFLIGGINKNFNTSSRITDSPFFVIEADEYDTAFFDKQSKFIHYRPQILIINNLEFDHADIFDSLKDIKKQFHYLVKTIPSNGIIIYPKGQKNITQVLKKGLWTNTKIVDIPKLTTTKFGTEFFINKTNKVRWQLLGKHNMTNALCAIHAAHHVGVSINICCNALNKFKGVQGRLEIKYQDKTTTLYDDFAHHPSAIKATLSGLRAQVKKQKIIAILEFRSNTMKIGSNKHKLTDAFTDADKVFILRPKNINWDIEKLFSANKKITLFDNVNKIADKSSNLRNSHLVVMSNGNFGDIHNKIIKLKTSINKNQ